MTTGARRELPADVRQLAMLCGCYALAATFILIVPMWVGALIAAHVANQETAGALATLELGAVAATMLGGSRFSRRASPIVHLAFGVLTILGYGLSALAWTSWQLAPLRLAAGIGSGWLLSATLSVAAGRANPTRTFAVMEIFLALYACVLYAVVGYAIEAARYAGGFGAIAAMLLLFLPCLIALKPRPESLEHKAAGKPIEPAGWLCVGAHFLFFVAMYSVWTFLSQKGETVGVGAQGLGNLLSMAFVAGLGGSALTMVLIPLFGRRLLIPIVLAVLAATLVVLGHTHTALIFYAAVILIKGGFLFYTVSMSGQLAAWDSSGRLNTVGLAGGMIGSAIGPIIGGFTLERAGFALLATFVAVAWLLVAATFLAATRRTLMA